MILIHYIHPTIMTMTEINVSVTMGMSATVEEISATVKEMCVTVEEMSATVEKLNNITTVSCHWRGCG